MRFVEAAIPGCYEITPQIFEDERGLFIKTFHKGFFAERGLNTQFDEEFYSVSRKGVLRGLHFQIPPHDLTKLVYCVSGEVLDIVVDLRVGSPTYGEFATFELSATKANLLYIPAGLAHGFYSLKDNTVMMYKCSTVYSPEHDTGILWDSVGIPWLDNSPIVSKRDNSFVRFADFMSPFIFSKESKDE